MEMNDLTWLEDTLKGFPERGVALYVRAATRYRGPKGRVKDASSELTQAGRGLSRDFGTLLKGQLAGVVSAPGKTSVETARCILEGADISSDTLQVDDGIGDPSSYVRNVMLLEQEIGELSPDVARDALLTGILRERAAWAAEDPRTAAQTIQAKLVAAIRPGKVALFVAPSVAIAATVGFALGLEASFGHADCPTTLEGAVIFHAADGNVWFRMGSHDGRSVL